MTFVQTHRCDSDCHVEVEGSDRPPASWFVVQAADGSPPVRHFCSLQCIATWATAVTEAVTV